MKSKSGDLVYQIQVEGFPDLSQLDQVNAISAALPGAVGRIPITIPPPRLRLEESPDIPHVTESRVERILVKLNPSKVFGPDQIRNWLLKEFSQRLFPILKSLTLPLKEQPFTIYEEDSRCHSFAKEETSAAFGKGLASNLTSSGCLLSLKWQRASLWMITSSH